MRTSRWGFQLNRANTPRGNVVARAPASLWSSTFSNTPTTLIYMGGSLASTGLSPESHCLTGHCCASLKASGITWLEDTSSLGKGAEREMEGSFLGWEHRSYGSGPFPRVIDHRWDLADTGFHLSS